MKLYQLFEYGKIVPGVNTTQDVDIYTTQREAAKLGHKVDIGGRPPLLTDQEKFLKKMAPKNSD